MEKFERPITESEKIVTKLLDIYAEIKQKYGDKSQFKTIEIHLPKVINQMNEITLDEQKGDEDGN